MNLRNCMPFLLLLSAGAALADAPPAPTVAPSTVVVTTVLTSGEIRNVWLGAAAIRVRATYIGATATALGMAEVVCSESAVIGEVPLAKAASVLPDVFRSRPVT